MPATPTSRDSDAVHGVHRGRILASVPEAGRVPCRHGVFSPRAARLGGAVSQPAGLPAVRGDDGTVSAPRRLPSGCPPAQALVRRPRWIPPCRPRNPRIGPPAVPAPGPLEVPPADRAAGRCRLSGLRRLPRSPPWAARTTSVAVPVTAVTLLSASCSLPVRLLVCPRAASVSFRIPASPSSWLYWQARHSEIPAGPRIVCAACRPKSIALLACGSFPVS